MRRLAALVALAVLVVGAATIADYPGTVDITWQDWEIGTSVGVLIAAVALLAFALWLLLSLIAAAVRLPRRFHRNRRERRHRLGERALTRGLIAIAAGESGTAQRQARRAEALLGATPLVQMLAAQTAQLDGDEGEARQRYTALLDDKDGEFIGLRGLVGQAIRGGDLDAALRHAQRAYELRPNAAWAFEALFALQTRTRRWEAARETLAAGVRRHLLPAERGRHYRGALIYEMSLEAEAEGDRRRAISMAAEAHTLLPEIAAPAVRQAKLLIADGRRRPARRIIEQAWRTTPHPALAAIWSELGSGMPALELVAWFEMLASHNPDAAESAVALAEAALAAQLWGEARRHLGRALAAEPTAPPRRLCLLMARLEDAEHQDAAKAREWYDRALGAPPDPAYVCGRCGQEHADWHGLCAHCHGFDTLTWRAPGGATAAHLPALLDEPTPAPLLPTPDGLAAAGQSAR